MERSLSVFLPVHNGQATLEANVNGVLEVLPELARNFDVLIIDDGSSDATAEIGHELTLRYPQVKLVRHPLQLGLPEAIQTGLDCSSGETIVVHDGRPTLDPQDIPRLWRRVDPSISDVRSAAAPRQSWLGSLLLWLGVGEQTSRSERPTNSFHLMHRRSIEHARRENRRPNVRATGNYQVHGARPADDSLGLSVNPFPWADGLRTNQGQHSPARGSRYRVAHSLKRFAVEE